MNDLKIILVSGLPGSGKSTTAEGIAEKLRVPVFSVDPIESAIIKSGIKRSFETGLAAYFVAEVLSDEQLKLGQSVIIDAVNAPEEAKSIWRKLAAKHHTRLIIIECYCSDERIHKTRIEARIRNMHGLDEVTWDDVQTRKREFTPWQETVLRLDALNRSDENIAKAIKYIKDADRT